MARARRSSNKHFATRARRRDHGEYLSRTVLCRLGGITEDQLSLWEFEDFITAATILEIDGHRERVYDAASLRRVRTIRSLSEDLGVNLPGIGVILELLDRMG
jgi:DNA-binding transcriptional MerR regulator